MLIHSRRVAIRLPLAGVVPVRPLARVQFALGRQSLPLAPLAHGRTIFDTGRSLFGEPATTEPMKVVLLSGFLGAGKTTVLEQLLKEKHGFKLGVVVNDLASVNVDANVLRKSIEDAGVHSVSLENGCVCCTAADDLRESVNKLAADAGPELDAIVVEMSGVAEPSLIKRSLETKGYNTWWRRNRPISIRTITVVDSPAFATDYLKEQTSHEEHEHTASGECDERFGVLLAEQVECADMILLNKADVASEAELQQTKAVVKALNEAADTRITEYGKVKVSELLGTMQVGAAGSGLVDPPDPTQPPEKVSSCCAAKTCSKTNKDSTANCSEELGQKDAKSRAETRFGITSFVYTTERLMSQKKLWPHMNYWQQSNAALGNKLTLEGLNDEDIPVMTGPDSAVGADSPLSPVLRSKGILLIDANPEVAFYWSHAGKSVKFSIMGPWPPNIPQSEGGFGARRTELVFIGAGYDELAIRNLLDSCLLTDDELGQVHG